MWVELLKDFMGKKAGERIHLDDAEAATLVNGALARSVSDDPIQAAIARGIEGALAGFTRGLDGIIASTLKQFADAQSQSRRVGAPLIFGPGEKGDPDHNFGDWLLCVATGNRKRLEEHYKSEFVVSRTKAAMGESSGTTGGYVVPPEFYQGLLAIVDENAIFRKQGAWVQPMASATLMFPYLDITTAQAAGTSPFFGGVKMNWTEEAQNRTETEPAFKMMELKAHELSGYAVSSNVLLQDAAFGLEKFLRMLFGRAIAWYEDFAFFQGDGTGKPQGVVGANATVQVTRSASATIAFSDLSKMWGSLLPSSWERCFWAFSPTCVQQLLQLKDGANRALFMTVEAGGIHQKPSWTLLNRPAVPTEKLPALGTRGDLCLIDPMLYVIGDRMQIEIAASEHVNFLKNQMTWRVTERVDGQPWMDNKVTLQDATTQVSAFVVLSTL
jgi:HK97 family phage major capsid protein